MGPDFLYLGCAKAGSAWLYEQLSDHPGFWMPPIKELHVLDMLQHGQPPRGLRRTARDRLEKARKAAQETGKKHKVRARPFLRHVLRPAERDLDWYLSLFRWKKNRLSGDITPAHAALQEETIAKVVERLPQVRGIFLVRDPVERAWSHFNMALRQAQNRNKTSPTIGDPTHWPDVRQWLESEPVAAKCYPSRAYQAWTAHLPPERIFVGFFDDLVRDPATLRSRVISFLGADPTQSRGRFPAEQNSKRNKKKLPLSDHMRAEMALFFQQELEDCANIFGGPAKDWLLRYTRHPAGANSSR